MTTELLEKNKNDLKVVKTVIYNTNTITSKALPIQLILEVKNTDNKYKTAR